MNVKRCRRVLGSGRIRQVGDVPAAEVHPSRPTYVIPCGGEKATTARAARDLYTGQMFRHTLATVLNLAADDDARVMILSARYGLVDLDTVIEPYEQRMDRPGAIGPDDLTVQAVTADLGSEVYAFLPRPYLSTLDAALRPLGIWVQDVYEATAGIGDQRHVNAVART